MSCHMTCRQNVANITNIDDNNDIDGNKFRNVMPAMYKGQTNPIMPCHWCTKNGEELLEMMLKKIYHATRISWSLSLVNKGRNPMMKPK